WGNSRPPAHPGPGWEGCRPLLLCAPSSQKSTMESKDEGWVRGERPGMTSLPPQELTGILPAEYPFRPGEKAPKVRRRIGAAYKLDEWALHREVRRCRAPPLLPEAGGCGPQALPPLCRGLCSSITQLRPLGSAWMRGTCQRVAHVASGKPCRHQNREGWDLKGGHGVQSPLGASDDSSLLDGLLREEEASQVPKPPPESPDAPSRPLPPQSLEGLQPAGLDTGGLERAPIQNSPWKETSLDHPYEKPRKSSEPGSESSPASTPQDGPSASSPASCYVVAVHNVPGQRQGRTSAPATPEMQGRRGQSQPLSSRPHSLDRQGAFRVPTVCVLRRSPEGAPVQVFVPENGEIISQV
ncbi:hypothetical protein E2I00_010404, partial [Balaenoptera physalus]